MESRAHAIVAVSFLIVFSAGAAMVYYWIAAGPAEPRYYRVVTRQAVGGLQPQSPVTFKGLLVGHVQRVDFAERQPARVEILFSVQRDAMVTGATYGVLARQGLTGGTALALKLGEGRRKRLQTSRDAPARIPLRKGLLARLKSRGMESMKRINHVLARLQALLDGNNRRHVAAILAQLDRATRELVRIEDRMLPVVAALPGLIDKAGQTLEQGRALLAQVSQLARKAEQPLAQFDETAGSARVLMRRLSRQLLPEIARLADDLARTSRSLRQLSRQLQARPQSLLFGAPAPPPGPGEPGFGTRDAR